MIRIFVTGGTFDKEYNLLKGELFFQDTHLNDLLEEGRNQVPVQITTLMLKDSLDITPQEREYIVRSCADCPEERIVVTHGTDTMVQTAMSLAAQLKGKTIVITGAMIPIKFGSSDGLFNIGSALAFAQSLPPGVYIAMNGKYFPHDNVVKNKKTGIFEEL